MYIRPMIAGDILLGSSSADLATPFGVLHHILNVSQVLGEIARVLETRGLFAVREQISCMGNLQRRDLRPTNRAYQLSGSNGRRSIRDSGCCGGG